jgi:putative glutamine amidotransferase
MRHKPLILLTPSVSKHGTEFSDVALNLSECYPRALVDAGGVPIILSCTPDGNYLQDVVKRSDGVMLTGGDDVNPGLYTTDLAPELERTVGPAEPERDLFELLVIGEVSRQRKPLLAICRGHQLLNVAFGGSLIVDVQTQLPQAIAHRRFDRKNWPVHEITLAPDSLVEQVFGRCSLKVNSTHHQAIDRLAEPFVATAWGPDGLVEVYELAPRDQKLLPWLLSVQFHPERLVVNYPEFRPLFRAFVQACINGAEAPISDRRIP